MCAEHLYSTRARINAVCMWMIETNLKKSSIFHVFGSKMKCFLVAKAHRKIFDVVVLRFILFGAPFKTLNTSNVYQAHQV